MAELRLKQVAVEDSNPGVLLEIDVPHVFDLAEMPFSLLAEGVEGRRDVEVEGLEEVDGGLPFSDELPDVIGLSEVSEAVQERQSVILEGHIVCEKRVSRVFDIKFFNDHREGLFVESIEVFLVLRNVGIELGLD